MPLVLVPLLGAEPVVPIIAISAMFSNTSRMSAFIKHVDWRRAAIIVALPGAFLAKAFVERMPIHVHTAVLDAIVLIGCLLLDLHAVR